jgi:hypothetical protein
MRVRSHVVLEVRFGPSSSPSLHRAIAHASGHADSLEETSPGAWRVTFDLGEDEERYGRALELLHMISGLRSTQFELGGSPEPRSVTSQMLSCARAWLRDRGRCQSLFGLRLPEKCRACALYDPEWALESCSEPGQVYLLVGGEVLGIQIPDHLPEGWDEGDPGLPEER